MALLWDQNSQGVRRSWPQPVDLLPGGQIARIPLWQPHRPALRPPIDWSAPAPPSIRHGRTKEKFLPDVARGAITAFALTEDEVGSDPSRLNTLAKPIKGGKSYLINGQKLWCTNGTKAKYLVVMARTPSTTGSGGKRKRAITAFVVDARSPGIEILHRCRFMGLRALYNGVVRFTNVEVPAENVILAPAKVCGSPSMH